MRIMDLTEDQRREMLDDVLRYARLTGDYSRFDDLMNHSWDELTDHWENDDDSA